MTHFHLAYKGQGSVIYAGTFDTIEEAQRKAKEEREYERESETPHRVSVWKCDGVCPVGAAVTRCKRCRKKREDVDETGECADCWYGNLMERTRMTVALMNTTKYVNNEEAKMVVFMHMFHPKIARSRKPKDMTLMAELRQTARNR